MAVASWVPGRRKARSPAMLPVSDGSAVAQIRSGDCGDSVSMLCRGLVQQLLEKTRYEYDTSALPYLFVRNSTTAQQHASLMYHCDKKVLAAALSESVSGEDVHVRVNIKMCSDCHSAFKHASALFKQRVVCDDGSHHHVFENGRCSCNDKWR